MSADLKPDTGRGHIAIPTETMEQEFQKHYRKGYEAATAAAQAKIAALETERDKLQLARDGLMDALYDEITENFRLRDLGGALKDEDMPTFLARVFRERDALTAELHEQARQNGMGSEREARLMARVAALEKAGAPMANTMFNLAQREHWPAFERESFKAMQVAWDSASSAAGEATND